MQLVAQASAHDPSKYKRHFRTLEGLVDIWSEGGYYLESYVAALRETIANTSSHGDVSVRNVASTEVSGNAERMVTSESRKDAPYIMPSSHGDISTPFYDLPAGNLMPCIVPNSLSPINPQAVKPMALRAGPADERLVHAVESFLHDVDSVYTTNRPGNDIESWDIDALGQLIVPDDLPGRSSRGEGYYGWSEVFCEKMKLRDFEKSIEGSLLQYHRMDRRSRKQRRSSDSNSSRSRSHSQASSRFPSNGRKARRIERRHSGSDSRSRDPSIPRLQHSNRSCSPGVPSHTRSDLLRSRTRSYSPPDLVAAPEDWRAGNTITTTPTGRSLQTASPTPAFLPQGFYDPGQIPIPPPPPPNFHGQWPPPPPVPPGFNSSPVTALPGRQSGQYMGQGYHGTTGNVTSLVSQPWTHENAAAAASRGRKGRGH
ncbi:MAG: hypothetical protein Q9216_000884 [Gyalolechia sp. 2 TL-2023]